LPVGPDTELAGVTNPTIEVGRGKVAILAIARPNVAPTCLKAHLQLHVKEASPLAAEQLAIYPSHVFNALEKSEGQPFGYAGTLLDTRPRAMAADLSPGWRTWDVSEIVNLWLSREPFPSQARVPKEGPIVLALRDLDGAKPFGTMTFSSADATDRAPYLSITQSEDC
jgi:hypothetical protein